MKGITMKRTTTRQSILTLTMAATAAFPLSGGWSTAHASTRASVTTTQATASRTFKGSVQQMQQWGPIQVSIVVAKKKIAKVNVSATAHSGRSVEIQSNAIPILKSETLKAQSATIDTISGATDMSTAYIVSLQDALKSARAAKALK